MAMRPAHSKNAVGDMSEYQLETEGFSIVALGAFNPSIFQPLWFSAHNLIRQEEANAAKIEIIHRNATIFSTEWLSLQVTEGNFTALTQDPTKSLPLRDLVIGTFKLLEHTSLTAFGFNGFGQFSAPSEDRWHAFEHYFAPSEPWGPILKVPGLTSLVMEGTREGSPDKIQVRIESSVKVPLGVFITINQHHDLPTKEIRPEMTQAERNKVFLTELQNQWNDFLSYVKGAREHLLAASASITSRTPKKKKG
jgi:hypothetical protein